MPSSTRSRSRRGTNGPEETPNSSSKNLTPELLPQSPAPDESPLTEEVAEAAVVEHKPYKSGKIFLSSQDIKLASKMSKAISESLGLNSRSRSYRV